MRRSREFQTGPPPTVNATSGAASVIGWVLRLSVTERSQGAEGLPPRPRGFGSGAAPGPGRNRPDDANEAEVLPFATYVTPADEWLDIAAATIAPGRRSALTYTPMPEQRFPVR
jgi:hypothetical protein